MRKHIRHWQDVASLLVAVWLIASTWVLGIQGPLAAQGDFVVIGGVLFLLELGALWVPESWEEWSEIALGAWLLASPWTLGFADVPRASLNAIVTGVVVVSLAVWVLGTDDEFGGWFHRLQR